MALPGDLRPGDARRAERLIAAAVALHVAVVVRFAWQQHHLAVAAAVVAAGVIVRAVVAGGGSSSAGEPRRLVAVARAALVAQAALWLVVFVERTAPSRDQPVLLAVAVLGALALFASSWDLLRPVPRLGRWGAAAFLLSAAVVGAVLSVGRFTSIDVLMFQEVATERLMSGIDPYLPGYPLVYDPDVALFFYGPDLVADGTLTFGFPYPPVSLLLVLPGAVLGDVRVAHVAAVVLTGWLLLSLGRHRWPARTGAVLFVATPTTFLVTLRSWTECFLVLLLTAVVWAHLRAGRWRDVLFGVFLVVKQYALGLAPLYLLLLRRPWVARSTLAAGARAAGVAALLTVPWLLWNPGAFRRSLVDLLFLLPFRPGSLSLLAASVDLTGWPPPWLHTPVALVGAAAAILAALARSPRTPTGFAASVAMVLVVLFLLSKQAFGNYYFVVTGALFLAVAATGTATADGPGDGPDRRRAG